MRANLRRDKTHVSALYPLQLTIQVLPESPLTNKWWNKWLKMKGSSFIKAWNLTAVCSLSHQRGRTQPTSGASNKHSVFRAALPFTGSTEPNPILKATQILQLNWKNEDVMEGVRPAIPFGSELLTATFNLLRECLRINANWCIKKKKAVFAVSLLKWKYYNLPDPWIHQEQKWNFKLWFYAFSFFYSKTIAKQRLVCHIGYS